MVSQHKINVLLDYILQDYELKCDRDLAAFLKVMYPVIVKARMGEFDNFLICQVKSFTDLSQGEIENFLQ